MAAALGAEYCEICSDVDGVYTADPRIVPAARRIGTLSYEETQELAESGARVLNAQAVEFAKQEGIAIYARATSSPLPGSDPSIDGTVVRRYPPRSPGAVVGVASEREVLVLEADLAGRSDGLHQDFGHRSTLEPAAERIPLHELLTLLDRHAVAGKQMHQGSGERLTLVISRENFHDEARVRAEMTARFGDRVTLAGDLGAVSVVGAGINASFDNVRRGSQTLAAANAAPRGIATSSFRITWMIDRDRIEDAVRALHAEFLDNA
jgi:aspartate kinase